LIIKTYYLYIIKIIKLRYFNAVRILLFQTSLGWCNSCGWCSYDHVHTRKQTKKEKNEATIKLVTYMYAQISHNCYSIFHTE